MTRLAVLGRDLDRGRRVWEGFLFAAAKPDAPRIGGVRDNLPRRAARACLVCSFARALRMHAHRSPSSDPVCAGLQACRRGAAWSMDEAARASVVRGQRGTCLASASIVQWWKRITGLEAIGVDRVCCGFTLCGLLCCRMLCLRPTDATRLCHD